jgi:hypothetical protein
MTGDVFNVPPWHGQARSVAFVWRLTKGKNHATCELWTHPIGAELRVEAGGEFQRSEAGRDPLALIETAAAWKAQFQEKGWTG